MTNVLNLPKSFKVLVYLYRINEGKRTITDIVKATRITWSYTFHVLKEMETRGLVIRKKEGRVVWIELTKKGKEVGRLCYEINKALP